MNSKKGLYSHCDQIPGDIVRIQGKILTDYEDYGKKQLFQRQEAISYVTKIDLTNPFGDGQSK